MEMFSIFTVVMVVTRGSQLAVNSSDDTLKWVHVNLSNYHLSSGEKSISGGEQRYKQDGTESLLGRNKSLQQPGLC